MSELDINEKCRRNRRAERFYQSKLDEHEDAKRSTGYKHDLVADKFLIGMISRSLDLNRHVSDVEWSEIVTSYAETAKEWEREAERISKDWGVVDQTGSEGLPSSIFRQLWNCDVDLMRLGRAAAIDAYHEELRAEKRNADDREQAQQRIIETHAEMIRATRELERLISEGSAGPDIEAAKARLDAEREVHERALEDYHLIGWRRSPDYGSRVMKVEERRRQREQARKNKFQA